MAISFLIFYFRLNPMITLTVWEKHDQIVVHLKEKEEDYWSIIYCPGVFGSCSSAFVDPSQMVLQNSSSKCSKSFRSSCGCGFTLLPAPYHHRGEEREEVDILKPWSKMMITGWFDLVKNFEICQFQIGFFNANF